MLVSIVIRTYNESRYLAELLSAIHSQDTGAVSVEVVIVDSGSLDSTLDIAQQFNCRITSIEKDKFTFGRSLNVGCDLAKGDYLVFISGHCIPTDDSWLMSLIKPLVYNNCHYSYGRQIGRDSTKYSEMQVFKKYYPEKDNYPQAGFFCNNANSAMPKSVWRSYKFNEDLTGLEDMHLARTLVESGLNVGYSAIACVYHIHLENWFQIRTRYEREAVALCEVMPEIHMTKSDAWYYLRHAIFMDFQVAFSEKKLIKNMYQILMFRAMQYWGAHRGYIGHKPLSQEMKRHYFYPRYALQDSLATRRRKNRKIGSGCDTDDCSEPKLQSPQVNWNSNYQGESKCTKECA